MLNTQFYKLYFKKIFSLISLYEGFYDEEICGGYPADKYDDNLEKYITLGTERYFRQS